METYEVLERALGLIERPGNWNQGSYVGHGGSLCAMGACNQVARGSAGRPEFRGVGALTEVLRERGYPLGVMEFNDESTHAEVCDLFREAIRNEKAKAGIAVEVPAGAPVEPQEIAA